MQSFWAKSSWGFPKGKINENEEPVHCAIREVYEETGYDIKNLLVPSEYIELIINYQYTRLYLIRGVPISTVFIPRTRNEIKCCEWFPIEPLPVTKNENFVKDNLSMNGNSFFMILPFVKRLKKWLEKIQKNKHKGPGGNTGSPVFGSTGKQNTKFFENKTGSAANQASNRQRQRHKSMGDIEQQRSKSIGSQNFATPEQVAKHPGTNSACQEVAFGTADAQVAGGSASNKKSHGKKQSASHIESGNPGGSTGGRIQIKRKLFDPLTDNKPKVVDSNDPLAMFNECQAWVGFKLDYSKFV